MVSFTLLENALDSVEIGLEYFRKSRESQNRRDYKQCLLNLFQAAELLLKAAVSRQDAGRIFTQKSLKKHCKDPACPTESELHRCQSVKISELCELIKTHHRSEFSDHGLQLMRAVAQMRNNLQHFALEISPQSLAMQLSELYKLIFRPACVFRSIRSRIGIEVRSAIRIHSINRELNFFYRFLTRFFAAFHYRGIFPQ